MKLGAAVTLLAGISATCVSAFVGPTNVGGGVTNKASGGVSSTSMVGNGFGGATMGSSSGLVNLADEYAQREVNAMEQWAQENGAQKAPGVELFSEDGSNFQYITQSGVGAGQTVLYVPSNLVISSYAAEYEFGQSLKGAEDIVVAIDEGTRARLPLFRLMIKILAEYEKGQSSQFFPWLNSMPRQFYNGVSMTDACFNCLPPYAGWLASSERQNYANFAGAIRQGGYLPLRDETINNEQVLKWAYNIALTRFHEVWMPARAKLIAPIVDMINHGSQANCDIQVDNEGNFNVMAVYDIPPGSPLTISLGDPTNPTPLFAQYGFLPNDCATIFCKAMHLNDQIEELGYDFKDLLIQTQSGDIAPKVWDIFLLDILQKNDQGTADQFYAACKMNDEGTKKQFHDQYFGYTLQALKDHVYGILRDVEQLTAQAQSYDVRTHPRVPVIVAHNNLVQQTFSATAQALESMG
jgi:hypothetical protein